MVASVRQKSKGAICELAGSLVIVFPVILFAVSSSLLASALWEYRGEQAAAPFSWKEPALTLLLAVVCVLSAIWLYRGRSNWLPVRTLGQQESVQAHPVLVMSISGPSMLFDADMLIKDRRLRFEANQTWSDPVPLSSDIKDDIVKLRASPFSRWNWLQVMRALAPHFFKVERIYLLGSQRVEGSPVPGAQNWPKGAPNPGSYEWLESCKALLQGYVGKRCAIRCVESPIDFENMKAMVQALAAQIRDARREGYSDGEIMIDVTGGQKIASIAASLVTLSSRIKFQYVQTFPPPGKEPAVLGFDVVAERPPDLD